MKTPHFCAAFSVLHLSSTHFGAAGQIRTADLILTNHRRAFQPLLYKALRRFFCPKRKRSQPVCSIVSVRSFPRVGHGVGQTTFRTRTRGAPPTAANRAAPDAGLVLFVSIQSIFSQRVKQNSIPPFLSKTKQQIKAVAFIFFVSKTHRCNQRVRRHTRFLKIDSILRSLSGTYCSNLS